MPQIVRFYANADEKLALSAFRQEAENNSADRDLEDDEDFEVHWARLVRVQAGALKDCPSIALATYHGSSGTVTVHKL
jgi:hypothetical protein